MTWHKLGDVAKRMIELRANQLQDNPTSWVEHTCKYTRYKSDLDIWRVTCTCGRSHVDTHDKCVLWATSHDISEWRKAK